VPYTTTPWVRAGRVRTATGQTIHLDTPAWFAWLGETPAFCYSSVQLPLRLTVRREQRRHQHYWYGYTKVEAKLHNIYLGKREGLTQARLERACQHLWQQIQEQTSTQP
jgi:hypothetical protein